MLLNCPMHVLLQTWSSLQLPAVTAVYAGTDQLPAAVEAAVRAQQNNATSVSLALAAAKILEKVSSRFCQPSLFINSHAFPRFLTLSNFLVSKPVVKICSLRQTVGLVQLGC
jgi:hypothetical protein